jgi:predicted enzyme related to lactoylglutathione lyase
MDYWLIETSPDGQGIGGGMMKRQAPEQGPVNHIGVESVDEHLEKAGRLGATVIVPKMAVAGVGYIAVVLDPHGNPLGLYKGDTSAQ